MTTINNYQFSDGSNKPLIFPPDYIQIVYDALSNNNTYAILNKSSNILSPQQLNDEEYICNLLKKQYPNLFEIKKDLFEDNENTHNKFTKLLIPVEDQLQYGSCFVHPIQTALEIILLKNKFKYYQKISSKELLEYKKILIYDRPSRIFINYISERLTTLYTQYNIIVQGGYSILPLLATCIHGVSPETAYTYPTILTYDNFIWFLEEYNKYKNDNTYIIDKPMDNMIKEAYTKIIYPPDSYLMSMGKSIFPELKITSTISPMTKKIMEDSNKVINYIKNMIDEQVPIYLGFNIFNNFTNLYFINNVASDFIQNNKHYIIDMPLYGKGQFTKLQTIEGSNTFYLYGNFNTRITLDDILNITVPQEYNGPLITGQYSVYQIYKDKILVGNNLITNFIDTKIYELPSDVYVLLNNIGAHAVTIVGYDDKLRTILIRNSWGASWGSKGYASMPYDFILNGIGNNIFWSSLYTIE